jgi:outer membrane protein assembly factor BamB
VEDNPESILVCIDATPGKDSNRRRWMVRAVEPGRHAFFEGAPVVADGRVYIAVTRFEGDRALTAIHCYPADAEDTAPLPLWRTEICETRELLPAGGFGDRGVKVRNRHHLLTVAGLRVVYCSHSGAIVALDGRTGARVWAVRYPHREIREPEDDPGLRDLVPCLFANGLIYAAPSDSESLLCLDPATGATIWQRERLDVVHLLGVGQGKLIFTTWHNPQEGKLYTGGLRAVGALDGSDRTGWSLPDDGGGLAPFGRGLLVGDLVLWPTARKPFGVFAVRQIDGMQPDNPSLLHRVPSGNLVYANGCLLVTDQQTMYAFVPPEMMADEEAKALGKKSTDAPSAQQRLEAIVRSAETSRAAGEEPRAQAAWQKVVADEELSKLSMEDETGLPQSAGIIAALRLAKRSAAGDSRDHFAVSPSPFLLAVTRLPLSPSCDLTFARRERLLSYSPFMGAITARIWSKQDRTLFSRDRWTGELNWQQTLPFSPQWLTGFGNLVVTAGNEGLSAQKVSDGGPIWTFLAPPLGRYPGILGGELRVACDVLTPEPLHEFHVANGRLFILQGERRLLALDARSGRVLWQRWAPGATFAMPPPRGRFGIFVPVGDDSLLAQASGRLWLLDAATGKVRYEAPAPLQRMPRTPLVLDGNRVCIVTSNNVEVFDAASARTTWTCPLQGKSTRSGEPPLVVPAGDDLFVIVPENIGYRLHRLGSRTGKPLWRQPPLLSLESLEPYAWLAGPTALYHADSGRLTARSRTDGSILWQRPLSAPGAWKIALAGETLILHPHNSPGLQFRFRWLAGSVQWRMGPLTAEAPPSVELVDAEKGTLLQRINLEDVSPCPETRLNFARANVWPSVWFSREASSAAGVAVWWDDKGLLAGAGNRVKSLATQTQPGK